MAKIKQLALKSWDNIVNAARRRRFPPLYMNLKQFDPCVYDVLIQDIDEKDLQNQISKYLGKPYLQKLQENQLEFQKKRIGIIYGPGNRGFISLPTRTTKIASIWIHYLIDTGSPHTFLSEIALKALSLDATHNKSRVYIHGHSCSVSPSSPHFSNINLLGMDYLLRAKSLEYDLEQFKITLTDKEKE